MSTQRAGAAFDAFLPNAVKRSKAQRAWAPADGPIPAMFISHGAPPLFDDGPWMNSLLSWTTSLPKPTAIVILSAHWESAPIAITSSRAATPLVYDFGGFDARYYNMKYETSDASIVAALVSDVMPDHAPVHEHKNRGLDHGAWVPLKAMYPLGDVPVIQLSLPTQRPDQLFELGRRLRVLREHGVLIVGSGFWTHGLPHMTSEMIHHEKVPAWSSDFDSWAWDATKRLDLDSLVDFKDAPGMPYAHPSPEHFTPLFVVMGAASDDALPKLTIDGYMWGLSKKSFQIA